LEYAWEPDPSLRIVCHEGSQGFGGKSVKKENEGKAVET